MSRAATHPVMDLSAYVDGELDAARGAEVEAHVTACSACAALLADLRGLMGAAASMEDRGPQADLWPAIRRRIEAGGARVVPLEQGARLHRARRFSFTWTQLAAASVALVVIGGGAVWLAVSGRTALPGGAPATVAERASAPAGEVSLAADFADETYSAAIEDLHAALEASRDELDPETIRTVEANLAVIDRAISETRRALAADPGSVYLNEHLARQMQRKLDLLRTATAVATPSI